MGWGRKKPTNVHRFERKAAKKRQKAARAASAKKAAR